MLVWIWEKKREQCRGILLLSPRHFLIFDFLGISIFIHVNWACETPLCPGRGGAVLLETRKWNGREGRKLHLFFSLFLTEIVEFLRRANPLSEQGEQLRRTLAEKRRRHYRALLGSAEQSLARRLREKEAEVETAKRRNAELQARAAQLGAEVQLWQAKARSQEAVAASLRSHIQQGLMGGAHDRKVDSCGAAASEVQAAEDAESVYVDPDRAAPPEPSCKACRRRAATVLMLPCRHLSVCTECERVAHVCPLCSCVRSTSIEVYLS